MKKLKQWIFLLVIYLICVMFLGGCSGQQLQEEKVLNVSTVVVSKGSLKYNSLITGKIEAVQSVEVASKVPGKVDNVQVDIGSKVQKGQVLFSLEAADLAANVKVAETARESAQITYDLAQKNYDRGKELIASSVIGKADYENNYEGAFLKAKAGLSSANANLEKATTAYNEVFIRAPFNGVATACSINPGEMVTMQVPVITIVNLDQVVIGGFVPQEQINQLHTDQEAKVKVSAVSSDAIVGKISNISLAMDAQTKAYPIKVKIDNLEHLLKPGMYGEAQIKEDPQEIIIIPNGAILNDQGEKVVFVWENGLAKKRSIMVGLSDGQNTAVISGLKENEKIISSGLDLLKDGQPVKI